MDPEKPIIKFCKPIDTYTITNHLLFIWQIL